MFKQESSVRRVLPAVADTLYGLEMVKSPVFLSLRDAWFLSGWKFPKIGVAAIAAMIGMLRNCWFTLPTGVKLHFLQCYELREVWWFEVWRCEGTGAEKEKYGILGKTVKIIKTPLARHTRVVEQSGSPAIFWGKSGLIWKFTSGSIQNSYSEILQSRSQTSGSICPLNSSCYLASSSNGHRIYVSRHI